MLIKHKIFGVGISTGTVDQFVDGIFDLANNKVSAYVCFANVHMIRVAHENNPFKKVINNANIVTPDGQALTYYMRLFDGLNQERVAGMDMLPLLIKKAEKQNKSVYFYGSTEFVLNKIKEKIDNDYPNLKIAGLYSPPFRELTKEEDERHTGMINLANPDLLFVSLGCPKQEKWMAEHQYKINSVMLGVGQAFKTFCNLEKRLPPFARKLALEWAYRLILEPRRLWKRFLISNSWFLWECSKQMLYKVQHKKQ